MRKIQQSVRPSTLVEYYMHRSTHTKGFPAIYFRNGQQHRKCKFSPKKELSFRARFEPRTYHCRSFDVNNDTTEATDLPCTIFSLMRQARVLGLGNPACVLRGCRKERRVPCVQKLYSSMDCAWLNYSQQFIIFPLYPEHVFGVEILSQNRENLNCGISSMYRCSGIVFCVTAENANNSRFWHISTPHTPNIQYTRVQ